MHRNEIIRHFENYKSNQRKLVALGRELKGYYKLLDEELTKGKYNIIKSPILSGMPTGNLPNSPVEKWLEEVERWEGKTKRAHDILRVIRSVQKIERKTQAELDRVKLWREKMSKKEAFVIWHSYMEGRTTRAICSLYAKKFGREIQEGTMRKVRQRVLERLATLEE